MKEPLFHLIFGSHVEPVFIFTATWMSLYLISCVWHSRYVYHKHDALTVRCAKIKLGGIKIKILVK